MEYINYLIQNIQLIMSMFFKTVGLTIVSFVMIIIIDISYIRRILSGNVKVSPQFSNLMFIPILPLGFEMLRTFLMGMDIHNKIQQTILVMDNIIIATSLIWILIFISYFIYIYKFKIKNKEYISKKEDKKRRITNAIITIISIVLTIVIPFEKSITTAGTIYLTGPILNIIKILFTISLTICTLLLIMHKKKLTNVYVTPLLFMDAVYILLVVLEKFAGFYTTYISSFFVFIVMAIFFTLESQDRKILDDYKIAVEKEKKLKKGKENFLTNAFHDIISPIYIMQGYSDLFIEDNYIDEERIRYIETSAVKLKNVVENLVIISYIQKEKILVEQTSYNSEELYKKIKSDIEDYNTNDTVRITVETVGELTNNLYGDHDKIYTIITKIIYNAISNTNYGEVKLSISEEKLDKHYIQISFNISNSGHIMTEEMYNMGFEDYIIENNSVHSERIGLLIAKSFTDMLGGEIEFINKEGMGTQYNVKITQKLL